MAWIESHDDIWTHHKTRALCRALKIRPIEAVGHLTSLWHFVLVNAWESANLEAWGEDGLEEAARWDGNPGAFILAAREAGFVDGFTVYGWLERAGKLVQDRIYNKERRKNVTLRRKADATLPNRTQPNPTQPNWAKSPFSCPTIDQVTAYCLERRKGVDPEQWFNFYSAKGWMIGKNKMKDWKAAVRTWEKNAVDEEGDRGRKAFDDYSKSTSTF